MNEDGNLQRTIESSSKQHHNPNKATATKRPVDPETQLNIEIPLH